MRNDFSGYVMASVTSLPISDVLRAGWQYSMLSFRFSKYQLHNFQHRYSNIYASSEIRYYYLASYK